MRRRQKAAKRDSNVGNVTPAFLHPPAQYKATSMPDRVWEGGKCNILISWDNMISGHQGAAGNRAEESRKAGQCPLFYDTVLSGRISISAGYRARPSGLPSRRILTQAADVSGWKIRVTMRQAQIPFEIRRPRPGGPAIRAGLLYGDGARHDGRRGSLRGFPWTSLERGKGKGALANREGTAAGHEGSFAFVMHEEPGSNNFGEWPHLAFSLSWCWKSRRPPKRASRSLMRSIS